MDLSTSIEYTEKFFDELSFQELGHIYTVRGKRIKSVSSLIPYFYEYVDWEEVAERYAFKHRMLTSEVLKMWREAGDIGASEGTAVHSYGEKEYLEREAKRKKEEAIDKFYATLDHTRYVILHRELKMWHKEYWYSGTTDLVLHDLWTGTDIIGDWKTNKDIHKNFAGRTLLHPFSELLDNALKKFNIQLNFYKLQYEQTGREVSEMWLIWLKEDGEYELFKIPDYSARLEVWLHGKTFIIG